MGRVTSDVRLPDLEQLRGVCRHPRNFLADDFLETIEKTRTLGHIQFMRSVNEQAIEFLMLEEGIVLRMLVIDGA